MELPKPVTKTVKASEARQNLSALLNKVQRGEQRVVVEKNGSPVAAIISPGDFARFEHYDQQRRDELDALMCMRASFNDIPDEQIEREVAEVIREVRDDRRREQKQREELSQVLNRMKAAFRDLPPEELEKEFDRVIAEVRDHESSATLSSSRS